MREYIKIKKRGYVYPQIRVCYAKAIQVKPNKLFKTAPNRTRELKAFKTHII